MAGFLVTGGCGFIGSHLVELLLATGHGVTVLDDLSSGKAENLPAGADLIVGSVAEPGTVATAMEGMDGCFHLAAIASVERSREDWLATNRVNLGGAINVFNAARGAEPVPVVFASSAAVYGDNPVMPLAESAPLRPLSGYGADKVACELHARVADGVHGVPVTGFRFFNVYGPRQDPHSPYSGVISIFANRISRGNPITVFGDGEQVRDFVYVGDVVRYLVAAMYRPRRGAPVFNICTGRPTSVNQLAQLLGDLCGRSVEAVPAPARGGDIRLSIGNPGQLTTEFGFSCNTELRSGLQETLRWLG
ncbi:MAG: NAD-dependent epimerase/dehydratase family protein [Azospirillum sp.]|nr:NAD-dependent epimerase/dehydratase family protein [Azospirillum sp.]